jgi:hypothetical protein
VIYLLGLLAKAGHGKTTVANHLVATRGALVRSLAAPLKRAVQNVFGFSDAQLWGTQADKEADDPRYGFSPRWLLQRLGTEGLRQEFGEDVHLRALLHHLQREEAERPADPAARLYVVDDIRFPNDARFVHAGGPGYRGAVLRIVATDAPTGRHAGHASELAIDQVDPADVDATVVVARAQGVDHMLAAVDQALGAPGFASIHPALVPARE